MNLYLKLRKNISIEGDIQLATREIKHIFDEVTLIDRRNLSKIPSFVPEHNKTSNIRSAGIVGYLVSKPKIDLYRIPILLSFIQEIWCPRNTYASCEYGVNVSEAQCIIPMMAMSEFLSFVTTLEDDSVNDIVISLVDDTKGSASALKGINRVNTSSPHIHSFHKYKAKFFPRFVRSLIVSNIDLTKKHLIICDPYVGSGTTLIESSLLEYESFGYDIDPLSCFISEIKAKAVNFKFNDMCIPIDSFQNIQCQEIYNFPIEIANKFKKWNMEDEKKKYEKEISNELSLINSEIGFYKQLNEIALSDALTRKFNIRMMGTGSGRFALEIGNKSLDALIKNNLKSSINALKVIEYIEKAYDIHPATSHVFNGNATNRNCEDSYFDVIVTSPPYLPASSGRENYLVSKIISLTALGLLKDKEKILSDSVGSMTNKKNLQLDNLPQSVRHLYNWLMNDELRKIKAAPIVSYYNSIRKSLLEDKRTIKPGGKIIYIIGKESVFYNNKTKEILYKVECEQIFIEIAKSIGLTVEEIINIELDKKDAVARPRSSDKYYETAIIMIK